MEPKIEINGKTADLSNALPLTMGDWEDLEDIGVTMDKLAAGSGGSISFKVLCSFVTHISKKCNSEITREDVRTMSLESMKQFLDTVNPNSDEVRDSKK